MADELVSGFTGQLGGVLLKPSGGGIFAVRANGEVVFDKAETERFPEEGEVPKLLQDKQLLA